MFHIREDPHVFFAKHFFHNHHVINASKYKNVFFHKTPRFTKIMCSSISLSSVKYYTR